MAQLSFGIDVFLQQAALYNNQRIALVTNNAAQSSDGQMSRVAMQQAGCTITQLFSPEHGLTAAGPDGAFQSNGHDPITGLPVISLYGKKLAPTAADLKDIDLVLFDIPDIGSRFYTYLWTLTHVMESCAQNHKPLLLLDRPNPIGINLAMAEGPLLDETHCASFIGRCRMPIRHCCTMGELALYFAAHKMAGLELEIIKVPEYSRQQTEESVFNWVPTSPAIQHRQTALLYPGMALLEAVNVNEGRGTSMPFSFCGAPWIHADHLLQHWLIKNIPGIYTAACSCIPTSSVYAGQLCHGLQFAVSNEASLQPVAMGIALLQTLLQLYPHQLTERAYPTAANPSGSAHLDKLLGLPHAFARLQAGEKISTAVNPGWASSMQPYLLY